MTNYLGLRKADLSQVRKRKLTDTLKPINRRGAFLLLITLATLTVVAFSCKKDPVEVGLGIQPQEDRIDVLFSDTTTVSAHSEANDSVRTDETVRNLAGSYVDPVFGISTAGFYTQFLLSTSNPDFFNSPAPDSLILSLAYNGYYGDIDQPVTLKVYQLFTGLSSDSAYYSNAYRQRGTSPEPIASFSFTPQPEDSVMVDSIQYAPHLRLDLMKESPAFAQFLLDADPNSLENNSEWVKYAKGLFIVGEQAQAGGSILYFNLASELSKIELHYHNTDTNHLLYEFRLDGDCARYNYFEHNYDNADPLLKEQVSGGDTSLGAQTLYLQSMQGINSVFRLPKFKQWNTDFNIGITRAELVLPVINASETYPPPSKLLLGTYDEEGELVQLIDNNEGASFFGGTYDSTKTEYRFRMTRQLQRILNGDEENNEFVLLVSGRSVQANRVVIGGPQHPTDAMRLELIYVPVQ